MELWDLYTRDRAPTGITHIRGQEIPDGCFHLVVHVWIRNSHGDYLISQRSTTRPTYPLLWECAGGSVLSGESSLEGAIREVKEEVGLDLSTCPAELMFSKTRDVIDGKTFRDIMDVWRFEYDGPITLEAATTDEVAQAQWLSPAQIQTLWNDGQMVPTLFYFFEQFDL